MATLKIRYGGDGYRWYPGVRRIQCGGQWAVDDDSGDPMKGRDFDGNVETGNFDFTQTEACMLHVQLDKPTGYSDNEVCVVVPIGDAWLLGDDGKNIDRIP